MLPPSTMTMDSTEAEMGRLIKKRENTVHASLARHGSSLTLCRLHFAVAGLLMAVGRWQGVFPRAGRTPQPARHQARQPPPQAQRQDAQGGVQPPTDLAQPLR